MTQHTYRYKDIYTYIYKHIQRYTQDTYRHKDIYTANIKISHSNAIPIPFFQIGKMSCVWVTVPITQFFNVIYDFSSEIDLFVSINIPT